jgi:hypothetical protein
MISGLSSLPLLPSLLSHWRPASVPLFERFGSTQLRLSAETNLLAEL